MRANLRWPDRLIRALLGLLLIFAAVFLFKHPVARAAATVAGFFCLGEAFLSRCLLVSRLGVRKQKDSLPTENLFMIGVLGTQCIIAYEWWSAGWGKLTSTNFVSSIGKTLTNFANGTPFAWYKSFLLNVAIPNATGFAYAIEWSQMLIAITLAVAAWIYVFVKKPAVRRACASASLLALVGGLLMNANFYFAAGWSGAGSHGLNVVMFWIQGVLFYVWLTKLESTRS